MTLSDITDRQPVLKAIAEFNDLTREPFLEKYGYGGSRSYWLRHDGVLYDSKAILGAAHGYARPDEGPLAPTDFSGGEATVARTLRALRFEVVNQAGNGDGYRTSEDLAEEDVYTREDLKQLFGITDATINTGVFRPKGTSSVWLFITEEKPADRTPYRDHLDGDTLHWQGQTSGRTDAMIIEHEQRGLELLVFLRKRKYEFSGAGFRYLGPFRYVSHSGSNPASFVLHRESTEAVSSIAPNAADETPFDPASVEDSRQRTKRSILQRRGQRRFREALLAAYGQKCAITGCSVHDVLEAAHIYPYRGPETNKVVNGLLLRADLHTLFDCGLVAIDPDDNTVIVAPALRSSEYAALHGQALRRPSSRSQLPSREALALHRKECRF